jgi:4-hydroxy-2-oxoheptanedioate aldolase
MTDSPIRDLRKIEEGQAALGVWCTIPSTVTAELMAASGFDWICVDMQHGLLGYEQLVPMLQALPRAIPKIVRVPWNEPGVIGKALDAGADGVIVPLVSSAAEAAAAAGACRYPPHGYRSWGPMRALLDDPTFGPAVENQRVMCMPMIETVEAVENLDEILSVPGVDAAYVGPADLSLSASGALETPGHKPGDRELIDRILDGCRRHDVIPGIAQPGTDNVRRWRQAGFRLLVVDTDFGLLARAAEQMLDEARQDD